MEEQYLRWTGVRNGAATMVTLVMTEKTHSYTINTYQLDLQLFAYTSVTVIGQLYICPTFPI